MISARGLSRSFERKLALVDLDLDVEPGEILGFLGPNGAGKTTTVKLLTCMLPPTSGSATVAGFDVRTDPLDVKRRIGFVPESGALYENLTAGEYMELVAQLHHLDAALAQRRASEMLDILGILDDLHTRMSFFSKGMKQKVLIAGALVHNPSVLFLDEPLNGIDANGVVVIKELLRQLAAQGKTIFFSSHILDVVERLCTRIVIVAGGRKVAEGTPQAISERMGTERLEDAFTRLTGVQDANAAAGSLVRAVGCG